MTAAFPSKPAPAAMWIGTKCSSRGCAWEKNSCLVRSFIFSFLLAPSSMVAVSLAACSKSMHPGSAVGLERAAKSWNERMVISLEKMRISSSRRLCRDWLSSTFFCGSRLEYCETSTMRTSYLSPNTILNGGKHA